MNFIVSRLHRGKKLSERGQMAIFIALIFQVLFVFFAMIVNIGLIVHDKINLQNSVDIAAYYGAQRQAELLNAIAHENYQIRQAWKLLAWRLRVIGDLGYKGHPLQTENSAGYRDEPAFPLPSSGAGTSAWRPTVCVSNSLWGVNSQNICKDNNISIRAMPAGRVIAPFGILGAINILGASTTNTLRGAAGADCNAAGPVNFHLAIRWITAYRTQVAQSKELIRKYADMLSQTAGDFNDINGKSARGGAQKAFTRNLTRANNDSFDLERKGIKFYNSLGVSEGDRKKWLNEVALYPMIFYSDFSKASVSAPCIGISKPISGLGTDNLPVNDQSVPRDVQFVRNEPQTVDDKFHSIFGVEKNPWMMAYVGVYAETKPRKPYLPFGDPITLKAKAFAKPFGGRIGPWFYKQWQPGSNKSTGSGTSDQTDLLMPTPLDPSNTSSTGMGIQELAVPNYSRYPGDNMGLLSRLALSTFKDKIVRNYNQKKYLNAGFYTGTPAGADGLATVLPGEQFAQEQLAVGYPGPWIRDYEVAAVAPDLFDVTYYSVDQDAYNNYLAKSLAAYTITESEIPFDIGSKNRQLLFSVGQQVELAQKLHNPNAYWMIKDPKHLLTGWAPSGPFQYDFPEESFGKCEHPSSPEAPVPGKCAVGGRVGYSVKIISEDYLNSDKLPLGGEGVMGKIQNPPKDF